jgi:glycosyltransferase involved in cell wall biosynthesis
MGVDDRVHFGGFVDDRALILETMRSHHVFLFCHKTPESPRCLVEALVSGCPIVGYGSPYPAGLVAEHGGGSFVPLNDWEKLAALVIDLNADRGRLSTLIRAAARSGQLFDEETLFQHRSDLIKQHLPPGIAL